MFPSLADHPVFWDAVKALHIIAVIAWMAGMLYLPRLFVYHATAPVGSPQSEMLKVMERRLIRGIINPAMIVVWALGLTLAFGVGWWGANWLWVKLFLVTVLSGLHGFLSIWRRSLERDERRHSARFYRIVNEVPTVLMILIVFTVVLKPFG